VPAQPDSILAAPDEKQIMLLLKWYRNDILKKDSQQVVSALSAAENLFAEKGASLLRRQAWLLQHVYLAGKKENGQKSAFTMLEAADKAGGKGWWLTEAECWHHAGTFYFVGGMYGPAFEYLQKAQQVFEKRENEKSPMVLRYTGMLGHSYYSFGEYELAIRFFKKTIELPDYWSSVVYFPGVYNTIGLCYRQLKKYDSAAAWFNRSYEAAYAFKDSFCMALANGNLGYTFYLQNEYDKAVPLLETDFMVSTRAGEQGSAVNAAIALAAIYIKKGQLLHAENYMQQCRQFVYASTDANLRKGWYENLYHINKAKGDYLNTGLYADSLLIYKDSVAALRDKTIYNQTVLKIETEQHINDISRLENRRRQQLLLRNSLLVGVVLLGIIALLWVNRQLLKRNKEKEIARQQLVFAEQELQGYTQKLTEKNELLEQLRSEIDSQQKGSDRIENINSLLSATILTDEDWKTFRQLFEKVYPGFFIRLKEKMPDLSAADTRLLTLTKLKLPAKDMAAMLGISYDSIKKARQRLRKKINLPEEGGLEELVEMI
jgi:tetratricopeptide (TPR) repeat protein